jgi:hypothetical protein
VNQGGLALTLTSNAAFSKSISFGRASAAVTMPGWNHESRLLTREKCTARDQPAQRGRNVWRGFRQSMPSSI